jgi:tetratricopeptide (TPR) repeat protein
MKTKFAIAAALMLSMSGFAQKDELKAMKKIADKETAPTAQDIQAFKANIDKAEPLMGSATTEQKAEFFYYKGMYEFMGIMSNMNNPAKAQQSLKAAVDNFNKVIETEKDLKKKEYSKEIQEQIFPELKAQVVTMANALGKQSQFAIAVPLYETAFRMDPKDTLNLYNAAAFAVNAKDYNTALKHFEELDRIGFTNNKLSYTAKNKEGQVEYFADTKTRDIYIKSGYTSPGVHKDPSVKGDIVKNIALIYIHQGDTEKALQAMGKARKANPNDAGLLIAEAELYLKTNNTEMYKKLITEAATKNPNNADLFYNLGVITTATDKAEAMKHYDRALKIKPDYVNANINMGVLILDDEKKIVEEMNKPSTTDRQYEELKAKRNALYRKSLPYFDAAHKADPANKSVMEIMVGVYQALEMDKEAQAMKAKMK